MSMADREQQQQQQQQMVRLSADRQATESSTSSNGPTKSQVLAVAILLPLGGILLVLSGVTLAGTVIGLVVCTPLFLIFSPVLVPAAIAMGWFAVAGFVASGAMGAVALTALSWIVNYLRGAKEKVPDQMETVKRRMAEAGQRVKDIGQRTEVRGQETAAART